MSLTNKRMKGQKEENTINSLGEGEGQKERMLKVRIRSEPKEGKEKESIS